MERFPERERLTWRERLSDFGSRVILWACVANPGIPPQEIIDEIRADRLVKNEMNNLDAELENLYEDTK